MSTDGLGVQSAGRPSVNIANLRDAYAVFVYILTYPDVFIRALTLLVILPGMILLTIGAILTLFPDVRDLAVWLIAISGAGGLGGATALYRRWRQRESNDPPAS